MPGSSISTAPSRRGRASTRRRSRTTCCGAITHLGDTATILVVGLVVSAYGLWRWRKPSIPLFVTTVILGQVLISNTIKIDHRPRPAGAASAHGLHGDVVPERAYDRRGGHLSGVALVLGIGSSPRARAALGGVAVSIAVAVGCTRVLLGVHWFSDVLAGLVIGWSWFGICAVAFGGRLLRFGSPADRHRAHALRRRSRLIGRPVPAGRDPLGVVPSPSPATRPTRVLGDAH